MRFHLTQQAKHIFSPCNCYSYKGNTMGISLSNYKALRLVLSSDLGIWEIPFLRDTGCAARSTKET